MIRRNDVIDMLIKCTAYANDKTPAPAEATILAWEEHFAQFPQLTRDDGLAAVARLFRDPRDRLIQAADISKIARDLHQDRALRLPARATEQGDMTTNEHKTACMSEIRAILDGKRGFGAAP
jgi:hypothetical protein